MGRTDGGTQHRSCPRKQQARGSTQNPVYIFIHRQHSRHTSIPGPPCFALGVLGFDVFRVLPYNAAKFYKRKLWRFPLCVRSLVATQLRSHWLFHFHKYNLLVRAFRVHHVNKCSFDSAYCNVWHSLFLWCTV